MAEGGGVPGAQACSWLCWGMHLSSQGGKHQNRRENPSPTPTPRAKCSCRLLTRSRTRSVYRTTLFYVKHVLLHEVTSWACVHSVPDCSLAASPGRLPPGGSPGRVPGAGTFSVTDVPHAAGTRRAGACCTLRCPRWAPRWRAVQAGRGSAQGSVSTVEPPLGKVAGGPGGGGGSWA